jgi:DNA methylase
MPIPRSGKEKPDLVHEPYWSDGTATLYTGEADDVLAAELPTGSVDCVMTQPPDLESDGIADYIDRLRHVFAAARRVLADDATAWLALRDRFGDPGGLSASGRHARRSHDLARRGPGDSPHGRDTRSLLGIPWRVAAGLQDDGWLIRDAIVWPDQAARSKPAPGCTATTCKLIFLLAKQPNYWFDPGPMPQTPSGPGRRTQASRPVEAARWCIAAGCRPGGVVLDLFCSTAASGTAAVRLGRRFIGIASDAAACNRIRAELSHELSHDSQDRG